MKKIAYILAFILILGYSNQAFCSYKGLALIARNLAVKTKLPRTFCDEMATAQANYIKSLTGVTALSFANPELSLDEIVANGEFSVVKSIRLIKQLNIGEYGPDIAYNNNERNFATMINLASWNLQTSLESAQEWAIYRKEVDAGEIGVHSVNYYILDLINFLRIADHLVRADLEKHGSVRQVLKVLYMDLMIFERISSSGNPFYSETFAKAISVSNAYLGSYNSKGATTSEDTKKLPFRVRMGMKLAGKMEKEYPGSWDFYESPEFIELSSMLNRSITEFEQDVLFYIDKMQKEGGSDSEMEPIIASFITLLEKVEKRFGLLAKEEEGFAQRMKNGTALHQANYRVQSKIGEGQIHGNRKF